MKKKMQLSLLCMSIVLLAGCTKKSDLLKPYDANSQQSKFSYFDSADTTMAKPFASDLCVVTGDINTSALDLTSEAASIYCIDDQDILYAKNVHEKMNPASITKVMTVLLALEYGKLDDIVTVTEEAMITESNAALCNLKPGDKVSLETLIGMSLVRSGNDAAAAIAIYVGGNIKGFADMMNEKAKSLGATHTNFTNPHGLTDENHYTTAYDIYLIMQEAMKYQKFLDIIGMQEYEYTYTNAAGNTVSDSYTSTNRYFSGNASVPDGVKIIGGKTGTTNAAGSCLALLSKDTAGKWYCSVVMKADGSDILYEEMSSLLKLEP